MYSSIRSRVRSIDAHCVEATTLHFYAPKHRSMVEMLSPIGTRLSTSVPSRMVESLIVDGGRSVSHVAVEPPQQASQCPVDQQPQCAAAAMMHDPLRQGPSMAAASSWQGGCPTIAENQEWRPPMPSQHVIWPNPGYKIEANLWNLIERPR